MSAPAFDLQSHSTRSDGALEPAAVVQRAARAGVELLALTDHDTVDGVEEALRAARGAGVALLPATELSSLDADREDLHILGYGIDHRSAALAAALEDFRADRGARAQRMAGALREVGFALEVPDRGGAPVGRPHLAAAVFAHPDNRARLHDEGLQDFSMVLERYLVPGAPAYVRRTTPSVGEAIAVIHEAGGLATWAHPFWDLDADAAVLDAIDRFAAQGLDGVEAFYVTHTCAQTRLAAEACAARGLLSTGSADFHGPEHPRFSRFRAFDLCGLAPDLGPIPQAAQTATARADY